MKQDICGWCGLVEELGEMRRCEIRGEASRICLRCFAEVLMPLLRYADSDHRNLWQQTPSALP